MLVKKIRIISLFLIFFSLFISCENSIPYNEEENQNNFEAEEIKSSETVYYGNIHGSYQNYGGALPAGIQKSIAKADYNKLDFQNRSAIPALGSELNQIEYYVIARAEGEEPVSGSVSEEDKTFSISGLKFGIDWDIEVGINVKQIDENGNISWLRCFYDTTENVKLSQTELSITRNLILKPDTSGYGSVDLDLTVDTNITGLEIKLDDTEQKAKWQAALAADEEKEISVSKIKLANLPAGQYNLILLFKRNGESYSCYSTSQTINVINGMTTDTWQSNGTSLISTTGEFNLTSAIISNYVDSCIYVGPNSASRSIGVTPDNSNEGRAYSPLESVNEAIKRIRSANVRRDYKIFVSESISENIKIGGEGADVLPGTAASSITIQGLNNNAADVLMSPQLSTAPCLSIQTDIPVIFKNIKITTYSYSFFSQYNTSAQGGGLYIKTGSASPGVTLDSGALIDGCIISGTEAKGAGIYLDSGKLTIKTGAKISNNQVKNTKTSGAAEGGGIYINSGTVEICGGEISGNSASSSGISGIKAGGGIYIKDGGSLLLSGSFSMPYSGSAGQNDIYVEAADSIKIKNAISPQAGTSGAMATITPAATLGRNASIVSLASGSSLSSIAPYKDYFALSNNDWIIKANSAGNALVLDAPIYVAGVEGTRQVCTAAGSDTGNGTKSAPFATIEQAVNEIIGLNAAEDYTIYVDGQIIGLQSIPSSLTSSHASGITIKGASGNTSDILNGNGASGTVLTISSPVPVTIKDLIITGANNSGFGGGINMMSGSNVTLESGALIGGTSGSTAASVTNNSNKAARGAGIYSAGNLTLKNGSSVTYNYAGEMGGGIYCDGGSLSIKDCAVISLNGAGTSGGVYTTNDVTISGPVIITGNVNYTGNPSNLYLTSEKIINVAGLLTDGDKNAQIGISTGGTLNTGDSIVFTSNYGTFNSGTAPGTYFTGDRWTVAAGSGTSAGEAVLTTNGGGISIAPNYENITIGINQTIASASAATKEFTFTASAEDDDGSTVDVEIGNGEGKVSITDMKVTYHGETVPETVPGSNPVIRYYTKGTSSITFYSALPAGHYSITVSAVYNGRNYSAGFEVDILEVVDAENLTAELYAAFTEVSVSSAAGMDKISELCNAGNTFANKTVKLEGNIILSSDFTAISNFKGTFDGQKHTISGLSDQTALFVKLENGIIKRLSVAGSTTRAGIVETIQNGTVEDCISAVNITNSLSEVVGGVASNINSSGTIRNCVYKGKINTAEGSSVTGGILGEAYTATCHIENCINKGTINCKVWTGGIIGYAAGTGNGSYIRNCKNTGDLIYHAETRGLGGIVGYVSSSSLNIDNCCNTGVITGGQCTGIIACYGGNLIFNNNCNIGQAKYGVLGPAHQAARSISPVNNYSLSTVLSTGGAAWSTEKEGGATVDLSVITDSMIASFGDTEDEVNAVVNALNRWVNANGASVYASWIKNADGKPELNLGDLDKL